MTVWKLLRVLLWHALHGRGRDEVFVSITWDTPEHGGTITGEARDFEWTDDRDAFCIIDATNTDPTVDVWLEADRDRARAWRGVVEGGSDG